MSALPSKQAFQRHFVQSSSLLLNALLRNKRYLSKKRPSPLFSWISRRQVDRQKSCLHADVSYFLCCTRATKEIGDVCTKATKKATVLDKIDGTLRPVLPFPQIKDEKKATSFPGFSPTWAHFGFRTAYSGKRGFQSISQLINQSIN